MKHLVLAAALLVAPPAFALCEGKNLIDALPADQRAALDAATAAHPHPDGTVWQATKDDRRIVVIGTYHLNDLRMEDWAAGLAPHLDGATHLLVEAGPEEEAALARHMAEHPEAMSVMSGPTLPERLPPAEWDALRVAMEERGIPGFMTAKMKPWYISMLLGMPPCAMQSGFDNGLDKRLIAMAQDRDIPVRAVEPYDTLFTLFDNIPPEEELDLIRSSLPLEPLSEDVAVTLASSYFDGHIRVMWEFMRLMAIEDGTLTEPEVDATFAEAETALITLRNRAWMPVIEDEAGTGPIVVAVGALHLPGRDGVLSLLEADGYALRRLDQ
ncbi:TraB/GumN family protein [Falsirhodobacter halotolerans]|uniref:TraB/GumN family protein n=1 Tax=Falsirhodobacter halotolerans TaxID=1146892 RepID=UPI001FD26F5B|nr:TraB/GumN family protein [Falsirhodobacter halotolerans]MCJ8138736.1 TraB/GumN family protein [Falsirhodobacter halotolerans]